jgi:hypothetical protein
VPDAERNPHAGRPFTDDDAAIASALEEVSVPALLCSMVHITGDPSWIRSGLRPHAAMLNDYQGSMTDEEKALQEPRREDLHPLAVARPDILDVDEDIRAEGLRLDVSRLFTFG